MTKLRFSLLSIVALMMFISIHAVHAADVGPKPTMDFEFKQDLPDGDVLIMSGILYECQQADCSDAAPLEEVGPQRFYCEEFHCTALGYGFAPYHRIEIQFSDGQTRQSNIFETVDFQSYYTVTINADDLFVEAVSGLPAPSPEPIPEERSSMTNVVLGLAVLCCIGLVLLLGIGLAIFFVRRSKPAGE